MEATLKIPILSKEQLKHLQKARSELTKAGVIFDSGYDLIENIFDWELDWPLEGAELTDKKELVFNVKGKDKTLEHIILAHIILAEVELLKAKVLFQYEFNVFNNRVWRLGKISGAELKIRKPRKEPNEIKPK